MPPFRSEQLYCQWDWMTCHDQPVAASCGITITPTTPLDFTADYDYWIVAGGLLRHTRHSAPWLLEGLQALRAKNSPIASLCSGSFVLGQAGLLDGHDCAVHFSIKEEFESRFPNAHCLSDRDYVNDDGIITCPGGTAHNLAADLIGRHCGAVRAQKGLKYLLVDEQNIRKKSSAPRREPHVYSNRMVDRAIAFMRDHVASPTPLSKVAAHVGTNSRQLHRAFVANTNSSPGDYWRHIRLEAARQMLVETSKQITTIAIACGFSDASHFILRFREF
jgi:transcriptional regulator GlxA family with amidase domain